MTVGTSVPVLPRLRNARGHRLLFTAAIGRAWLKHSVEEVGMVEYIIPLLYPLRR